MTPNPTFALLAQTAYPYIRAWLIQYQTPITYGDLCRSLPAPFIGLEPNSPVLAGALAHIIGRCRAARPPLPLLSAMVVNATTQRPGPGYYQPAHQVDETHPTAIPLWRAELAAVIGATASYPPNLP